MILSRLNGKQIEVFTDKGLANACYQIFQAIAPVRTEFLKDHIHLDFTDTGFEIYITVAEVPYVPYTEEAWGYNSRWKKTLTNPNEGWFREAFEMCINMVSNITGRTFNRES